MPSTTTTTNLRPALRKAYLRVVDGFAVSTEEAGGDPKLLKRLQRAGLVEPTHVNGEKALTWQSHFDTQNGDDRKAAVAAFDVAFPKGQPVAPSDGRGGYGARYTPAQIKRGLKARAAGKSKQEVAKAAGVKSPRYFSRVLDREEAAQA